MNHYWLEVVCLMERSKYKLGTSERLEDLKSY